MNKELSVILQIRNGDPKAITTLYKEFKSSFLSYASRFSIDENDAIDVYQDTIITLYENILSGKLTTLTSSIKTYVFAIGKYKIYNKLKTNTKAPIHDELEIDWHEEKDEELLEIKEENILKLQIAYQQLGTKCKEVIKLYYYDNLSIDDIRVRLGYASKDVVKSQKSRCIKRIKEIVFEAK